MKFIEIETIPGSQSSDVDGRKDEDVSITAPLCYSSTPPPGPFPFCIYSATWYVYECQPLHPARVSDAV